MSRLLKIHKILSKALEEQLASCNKIKLEQRVDQRSKTSHSAHLDLKYVQTLIASFSFFHQVQCESDCGTQHLLVVLLLEPTTQV